jgi:hypothetical protein
VNAAIIARKVASTTSGDAPKSVASWRTLRNLLLDPVWSVHGAFVLLELADCGDPLLPFGDKPDNLLIDAVDLGAGLSDVVN